MFVFPGIGLGTTVCGAKMVTDRILYKAAEALASFVTEEELAEGKVFPRVEDIRKVSHAVACAVIREAVESGISTKIRNAGGTKKHYDDLENYVWKKMYDPQYVPIVEKPS
ncbi:hypothetical protein TeGR_g6181 [Tetraparma gracilis]|uniref:Malic enzyme NAD-binding domain-containing protein n=1 Tax=Tetraparma gracilis TaxID=2962635 RepID=A0ABQ6MPW3_9STRA|nr:hypothetical protein TeGR_g6181 [Tetraparma gracilis]